MRALVTSALLALILMPQPALAWWDKSWPYRKEITLDTGAAAGAVDGAVQNFPVLLRLDSGNFTFDDANPDGSDLRFVGEDDKTGLAYHVESFDPQLGLATIWVSVPNLPAGSQQKFWMYFGNKTAQSAGSSEQTFDPLFGAVYHFGTNETSPLDATARHDNAIGTVAYNVASWIGRGASFDGTAAPFILPPSPSLAVDPAQGFTFEAWVKARDADASGILYTNKAGGNGLTVGLDKGVPYVEIASDGTMRRTVPIATLGTSWTYIAVAGAAGSTTLYVNGNPGAVLQAAIPALPGGGAIGGDPADANAPGFSGEMDEVRLSSAARPAAYVKASFASEGQGAHLVTIGATEEPADSGFGYLGIVVKNVTPDAWVVIGILVVMGAMSWVVMWRKASYVGRTARANAAFMAYYNRLEGDLLTLEAQTGLSKRDLRALEQSSLYRIYKCVVAEIGMRRAEMGPNFHLGEESLAAIRISLDAAQIEEVQALDRGVVLLTISIAGAPFIGLLGTVLGVMITFAAIAAAGDVNVNSIAPGIAAALLATVTGLAVAIPALFGYNYIAGRNSDIAAKTQIFGDRLITRLAELQRHAQLARAAE